MSAVPYFIAEVSSNHHADLARCLRFIDTAAEIGCDAVKFQLFRVRELFASEILSRSAMHRAREAWELPVEFLPHLSARARERGIHFGLTPFYLGAVEQALPHVDFLKIASYELLWGDLLRACAQSGKPVLLSTGMAVLEEVVEAVATLKGAGCSDLTVLHCISSYPVPAEACNLSAIGALRNACGCPAGWSDHSVSAQVVQRAVHRWGASAIEFHLDLDGEGEEFGAGHCWLPAAAAAMITAVRAGNLPVPDNDPSDGNGIKAPVAEELPDRDWRADPVDGLRPLLHVRREWAIRPIDP